MLTLLYSQNDGAMVAVQDRIRCAMEEVYLIDSPHTKSMACLTPHEEHTGYLVHNREIWKPKGKQRHQSWQQDERCHGKWSNYQVLLGRLQGGESEQFPNLYKLEIDKVEMIGES